jgi:hypothetical protein
VRRARVIAHALAEQRDRQDDQRDADHQHARQLRRDREQVDQPADAGEGVAQRDRHRAADDLFDQRCVGSETRGDLGRAILLEEARRQAEQVALHVGADVRDDAFAEP